MNILLNFILILSFFLSFSIITHSQEPLYHICPNTTVFTGNSNYPTNRNQTLSSLTSNGNRSIGFYNTSAGQGPNDVFGVFLCRGDATIDQCQNCVASAAKEIVELCPVEVEAVIWYDFCLLRYSNRSLVSMANSPTVYKSNTQNISDQTRFNSLLATSMRESATAAANAKSGEKKFAVKEVNFTAFQTLYNLAQCTPDLSTADCIQCLDIAISQLPACCNGKQGGRVLTPSCNIRYEMYRFYTAPSPPPSPPPSPVILPPPPPTGSSGDMSTAAIIAIVAPSVSVLLFCMGCIFLRRRAKKNYNTLPGDASGVNEITTAGSLQVNLNTIQVATNNFSRDNKLGEGGFGEVYKGLLPNGQEIAVKKLSRGSSQGSEEFKNEVLLLAKLQHRNLVRLLGFCLEGEEKILVYEYVSNKSLDFFLFDEEKRGQLDWSRRYKIIGGIARGILYLHEDSRLRIIHRDLKASNVLLDGEMNAKISDFGMAKIFVVDQTQGNTSRILGTYGYMSPEYAMHGQFSVKSDMYSFGVLVLEIICGKKNSSFYQTDGAYDLGSYVWKHWREGTPMEVLDPVLEDSYSRNEVLRCIQIGLLCIQEDPIDRPSMATVVLMLNSYSVTLPMPRQPAFLLQSRSEQNMPMKGLESNSYSTTKSAVSGSVDDASITDVYPR
ncbi:cysteine-rich receptor-like protein kinase 10 [Euphorbia lathyris]|uniref:cysteine-rich receptor-like protein kinase 10 n=1 Tax=Euphorbia lathyris TaxID=212925 RepID=UPI0033135ACC